MRRHFILISFFLLQIFQVNAAWKLILTWNENDSLARVKVFPNLVDNASTEIYFETNILKQNAKGDFLTSILHQKPKSTEQKMQKAPLKVDAEMQFFSYEINLYSSSHVPSRALLSFGNLDLINWSEILFNTNEDSLALEIEVDFKGKSYSLGTKYLRQWQNEITKLQETKALLFINNVTIYSNDNSKELKDLLAKSLLNFKYLKEKKEVYLFFGEDSLPSAGLNVKGLSLIYIDKKLKPSSYFSETQKILLHELCHWLSSYEIRPEKEQVLIDKNWLAEASPEYLSLRYLLRNKLISELEFLEEMEIKLRKAQEFSSKSLHELSLGLYDNPAYMDAYYSKGVIALLLLDLKLFDLSKGKLTIDLIVRNAYPELDDAVQREVPNVLNEMENELVLSSKNFDLNKYLPIVGLIYEKQKVLPFSKEQNLAPIRWENISFNKLADAEQKSNWERFIAN
ncbi:MAG: hypothetical protein H6579_09080 [Chitinophagales bacterium]|nr:hypothetical protein [Chitinophagales bacterium]